MQIPSGVIRRRIKLSDWNESSQLPATHGRIQKESAKREILLKGSINRHFYSSRTHQGHNALFLRALGVFVVIKILRIFLIYRAIIDKIIILQLLFYSQFFDFTGQSISAVTQKNCSFVALATGKV